MNLADENSIFDTDSFLNAAYTAQVDLKLLVDCLARGHSPTVLIPVIVAVYTLHFRLQELTPTLTRH